MTSCEKNKGGKPVEEQRNPTRSSFSLTRFPAFFPACRCAGFLQKEELETQKIGSPLLRSREP